MTLRAKVPDWALWAGLPCPEKGECFSCYVTRIGLDAQNLLNGLTPNTAYIANHRLTTELMRQLPDRYEEYVQAKRRSRTTF